MAWDFDFFDTDVGKWLQDVYESDNPEAEIRAFEECLAELEGVLAGEIEELSPDCQERLGREADGSEQTADTSVQAFLQEWWWALGLVAAWLVLRGPGSPGDGLGSGREWLWAGGIVLGIIVLTRDSAPEGA